MGKALLRLLWLCLKYPTLGLFKTLNFIRKQILGGRILTKQGDTHYVPLWLVIGVVLVSAYWDTIVDVGQQIGDHIGWTAHSPIARFFAPSVQHWANDILNWSALYDVDVQLMATIMQIESCGHPSVVSPAGAQGLFQVMPLHFEDGEDMLDPNTNAKRGGLYLNYCYTATDGDIGLTFACYNGGPSVIGRPINTWADETQDYYHWGVEIFADAIANRSHSDTLDMWLMAGGNQLCTSATTALQTSSP